MSMDIDDYHEYMMVCGEDESSDNESCTNDLGCSSGCLPWILGVLVFLWIISKLA